MTTSTPLIPTLRTVPINDPAAVAHKIDEAMTLIPAGQQGSVLLTLSPDRRSLGVVWRSNGRTTLLMRIEKEGLVRTEVTAPPPPMPFSHRDVFLAFRKAHASVPMAVYATIRLGIGRREMAFGEMKISAQRGKS